MKKIYLFQYGLHPVLDKQPLPADIISLILSRFNFIFISYYCSRLYLYFSPIQLYNFRTLQQFQDQKHLKMTQLLNELQDAPDTTNSNRTPLNWKQLLLPQIKKDFLQKSILLLDYQPNIVALLDSYFFCLPSYSEVGFFSLLEVESHQELNLINFNMSIYKEDGKSIRAASIHQKTGLSRLCSTLNTKSKTLSFKCNPLTGEIKLIIHYFISNISLNHNIVKKIIKTIWQHKKQINIIFQFLQLIPFQRDTIFGCLSQKMEKCRTHLLNRHEDYIQSFQELQHSKYFFVPEQQFQLVYNELELTRKRMIIEERLRQLKQKLILTKNSSRENIKTDQLDQKSIYRIRQVKIQQKGKEKKSEEKGKKKKRVTLQCKSLRGGTILLDVSTKNPLYEIELIKKITKFNYFPFLRQYILLQNTEISLQMTIKKQEDLVELRNFLIKNKYTLSFLTKLQICIELVSVILVSLTSIKNFQPAISAFDISLTKNYDVKLQTVFTYFFNMMTSVQLAETCCQILYGTVPFYKHKQIDKSIPIRNIDDGQSMFQGNSIINFWLKKTLTDMMNNCQLQKRFLELSKNATRSCPHPQPNQKQIEKQSKVDSSQQTKIGERQKKQVEMIQKLFYVLQLGSESYTDLLQCRYRKNNADLV